MLAKNEILEDRYRIVRRLGHGGMGAVYEAIDERLGTSVALKEIIIDFERVPTEEARYRLRRAFRREAKLLAALNHEVFPRVTDYFTVENGQFLIMELVAGDDLERQLMKGKQPFPLTDVVAWTDELLGALEYLHTQSPPIFHRDIKPPNLKVTERGRIKLLDFGIAKSIEQNGSTLTNQTLVGATLEYAPLEQILPATQATFRDFIISKHRAQAESVLNRKTDARCDIYAVGATVYHLLTNRFPVDALKRSLQVWEGGADPLAAPHELNPAIPVGFSAWLLKALQLEPENRFASAAAMRADLHAAAEYSPEETPVVVNGENEAADINCARAEPAEITSQTKGSETQPAATIGSTPVPPVDDKKDSEQTFEQEENFSLPPPVPPSRPKFSFKRVAAGVSALCLLIAGVFGIRALIAGEQNQPLPQPVFNLANAAEPSQTPTASPKMSPSASPTASPSLAPTRPKPTATPPPKKKKGMSDDCLYNGNC